MTPSLTRLASSFLLILLKRRSLPRTPLHELALVLNHGTSRRGIRADPQWVTGQRCQSARDKDAIEEVATCCVPLFAVDAILQHVASWGDRIPHMWKIGNRIVLSSDRKSSITTARRSARVQHSEPLLRRHLNRPARRREFLGVFCSAAATWPLAASMGLRSTLSDVPMASSRTRQRRIQLRCQLLSKDRFGRRRKTSGLQPRSWLGR